MHTLTSSLLSRSSADLGASVMALFSQWWVWTIIGAIVLFFVVTGLLPGAKVKASDQYSTADTEANELALGFLQIRNLPSGDWNDPTASGLSERGKATIINQWGVRTRDDWLASLETLTTQRRRRDTWVAYLAIRSTLAARLGRVPTTKEWVNATVEEGGAKADARAFIWTLESLEAQVRKHVGKNIVTPDHFVKTLDGYAIGQAIAMVTWGVALGHTTTSEARQIIHDINTDARGDFTSWTDFGLSYIVGRVMHWSDGHIDEKTFDKFGDSWPDFRAASMATRNGPWATLPWGL